MKDNRKKYKVISQELVENLIAFLDEIQFDAATDNDKESMHKINFCSWAIKELLDSYDGYLREDPRKKSREDYVDETFMDWNLPEMSDDEYEKLVDQFDSFLKGWEKEYKKKEPKKGKKKKNKAKKPIFRPHIEDISEYMSLEEIKEFLLDDPELTADEAFDLYYEEHRRVQKEKERIKQEKNNAGSLDDICKELGIKRNPGRNK